MEHFIQFSEFLAVLTLYYYGTLNVLQSIQEIKNLSFDLFFSFLDNNSGRSFRKSSPISRIISVVFADVCLTMGAATLCINSRLRQI